MRAVWIAALSLAAGSVVEQETADLAVVGATVIDGTGGAPLPDRTILVRAGTIVAVAPSGELPQPDARTVIDASGLWVVPGLADAHVHFGSGGFLPRAPGETERVIHQFLHYGVTTVLNVGATGGSRREIVELRARQRAGELPPLHVFATGELLTVPGSHPIATIMSVPDGVDPATYDWTQRGVAVVADADEARTAARRNLEAGMDAVKIVVESGPPAFGEHPRMQLEQIRAVVDEARRHGKFVVAHATSLDELEDCIAGGVHAVIHAISEPPFPGPEQWAAMKERGMVYVPTLSLYGALSSCLWRDEDAWTDPFLIDGVDQAVCDSVRNYPHPAPNAEDEEYWRAILRSVRSAHDAGVLLAVGTDTNNPRVFPGYSVHRELEALVEAGLTPMEAIVAATRRPAELLGRAQEFGTVTVGKRADLVVLGADPLADIRNTRAIRAVVVDGQVVARE